MTLTAQAHDHLGLLAGPAHHDQTVMLRTMTAIAIAQFASDERLHLMPWGICTNPELAFEHAVAESALSITLFDEQLVRIDKAALTVADLIASLPAGDPRRETIQAQCTADAAVLTQKQWHSLEQACAKAAQDRLTNVLWIDHAPRTTTPIVNLFHELKRCALHAAQQLQDHEGHRPVLADAGAASS